MMNQTPQPMRLPLIWQCAACQTVNAQIVERLHAMAANDVARKSHLFNGRYENLYIGEDELPEIETILEAARHKAAEILQCDAQSLKLGFWYNIMQQGDITTLHTHDDDDELLSAVYYLKIPSESAQFRYHYEGSVSDIEPIEANFMFFDPRLPHEVTQHRNADSRISVAINFGPAETRTD